MQTTSQDVNHPKNIARDTSASHPDTEQRALEFPRLLKPAVKAVSLVAPAVSDCGSQQSLFTERAPDEIDLLAFSQSVVQREQKRVVPEGLRPRYRRLSLRQFYEDPEFGLRRSRVKAVTQRSKAQSTLQKDIAALSVWERFCGRPESVAFDQRFAGCAIGFVTNAYASEFLTRAIQVRSYAYIQGLWGHLRWMFNEAVRLEIIARPPQPAWPRRVTTGTEDLTTIYQTDGSGILETLTLIHKRLSIAPDLQDAFRFANATGMRPIDWSMLRWEQLRLSDRPIVAFNARKTGKAQSVPLAPSTVGMLKRRRSKLLVWHPDTLVFPGLTNPNAHDPEKSAPARRRTALLKWILRAVGLSAITFERPWQVCRATCNERLERHQGGAGQFVLGHANTLNSRSYREPSGMVFDAVCSLPQPECWS